MPQMPDPLHPAALPSDRRRRGTLRRALAVAALVSGLGEGLGPSPLAAQSIEPRSYSNAPVGTSFLIVGAAATEGGLAIDPAVPLTEPDLETWSGVVAYARFIDFWGKSAKFDVIAPYTLLSGTALFNGEPVEREISGLADPAFRLSVNLFGAPALSLAEFKDYHQKTIVGVSLQVTPPLGQYDETRLVNIGMNRWTFKPEIGVSRAIDAWTLEVKAGATLFTVNDDFNRGQTREQKPIYSTSGHAIYNFSRGRWASLDVNYFTGGVTTIAETRKQDLQRNWRLGATYAFPVSPRNSIKLYASSGVAARTGNNFDMLGIAWQHRWNRKPAAG